MDKNIDLHCDLTAYLAEPGTSVNGDIRCSLEKLLAGSIKLQVMALYSSTEKGSVDYVRKQVEKYFSLLDLEGVYPFLPSEPDLNHNLGIIAAIENASGLCEEDQPIEKMFANFDFINEKVKIMYVGLTHHLENRFGGGNFTDVGLKEDGKLLITHLHNRKIAIDLSHTSDRLAFDILNFVDKNNLKVPIIASHSNMRSVFYHKRNLPDELVLELIHRQGLIGMNLVKYFVNPENPDEIYRHIEYALKLGAEKNLCFGADFFDDKAHPDQSRYPYFFDELADSTAYHQMNNIIGTRFSKNIQKNISHQNVLDYFERLHKN